MHVAYTPLLLLIHVPRCLKYNSKFLEEPVKADGVKPFGEARALFEGFPLP